MIGAVEGPLYELRRTDALERSTERSKASTANSVNSLERTALSTFWAATYRSTIEDFAGLRQAMVA